MGSTDWQPKWWTQEKHGSTWDRVKEAMKRDWEQTKNDFKAGGRDLDQDVDDTVKQAAGKDAIPPRNQPNAPGGSSKQPKGWTDVEGAMRYGYGAREQYGSQHAAWNDKLEITLKSEWEETKDASRHGWNDVKDDVRRGYERDRR
jgi:hypothetical protein